LPVAGREAKAFVEFIEFVELIGFVELRSNRQPSAIGHQQATISVDSHQPTAEQFKTNCIWGISCLSMLGAEG